MKYDVIPFAQLAMVQTWDIHAYWRIFRKVTRHSYKPLVSEREGVLYVNPGSAGPRRFKLPIAVAEVRVFGHSIPARIVELRDSTAT